MTTTPGPLDARTLLGYLWEATGYRTQNLRVRDLFAGDDPLVADVERVLEAEARADVDGLTRERLVARIVALIPLPMNQDYINGFVDARDGIVSLILELSAGDKAEAPLVCLHCGGAHYTQRHAEYEAGDKTEHPFKDEWSFQRSMTRGNAMAGKPIAADQPCFTCEVPFADHHGAGDKAEAPLCCEDKGGAFCRDTTGATTCFNGWEHTREAGDKAEAPE